MTGPALVTRSVVTHRRHVDVERAFRYRVFHLLVDADDLAATQTRVRGFGPRRPLGLRTQDHFGPSDAPLRDKVGAWVQGHGATLGAGPLILWTYPRILGHVFNPVSWWWSFNPDGTLALAIAEVNNTFGDWHAYLLTDLDVRGHIVHAAADKDFHVSPFLPIEGLRYEFTMRPVDLGDPRQPVAARIRVVDDAGREVFDASQVGHPQPLTTASLWRAALAHPMVSVVTLGRIHWQALRLWLRRVPFFRRPEPPPTGLDHTAERTGVAA